LSPDPILVTGGTGNVGADVVRQLLDAGERVRVLTRDPDGHTWPDGVEVVRGDLNRPETLPAALAGVGRALLFPAAGGAGGFLDAAYPAGLRHVVLLSSASVTLPTPGYIGERHLRLERAVAASGLPWTFVRPGAFMTNDLAWAPQIIDDGARDGTPAEISPAVKDITQRPAFTYAQWASHRAAAFRPAGA